MPIATIELSEIQPSEKQEFRQVLQEYLRELDAVIGGDPLPGQTCEYPFWEEYWSDSTEHNKLWIVVGGGKVGFILLRHVPTAEWPGVPLPTQITEFCVFRPFRNREIGSSVLRFIIEDFRLRGEVLTWDCLTINARAEKMYDRVVREYSGRIGTGWTCQKAEFPAEAGPTYRYVCAPALM